ncbi:hypothetical protein [Nocardioides sp. MH1]|uniref:maltokinase N-terminal cap-like domain-containing protein n=1 Tax=Nocardioides sp. MH1 TaxID=3242490 RepID=UPI003521336B
MSTRAESLLGYLSEARWFGGKGREFTVSGVRRLGTVPGRAEPPVVIDLVEVTYPSHSPEPDEKELYQLPLVLATEPEAGLDSAFVGWWEDPDHGWVHAYDALHDRASTTLLLEAIAAEADADGLDFVRLPGHELELDAVPSLFSGEQSNSSVLFGEDSVLKVFRKITPGANPDITTHQVLTEADSPHVAALYGWIAAEDPGGTGEPLHLAMLQQFLRTASDGWEIALASVRDLFSEADLHAEEVGGDFAAEAARLGTALAEVHVQLREAFGADTLDAAVVAQQMALRLGAAIDVVPALAEHADRLRGAYGALADLGKIDVQRIHGDLHLGQTLRTIKGWKLVDFEGEPAKPLAERLLPDSPWRDVAGMLRSFDYAPHAMARSLPEDDPDVSAQRERRAEEWAARNKAAFLTTYAGAKATTAGGEEMTLTQEEGVLVAAYVADKTVYECVYEARNRPSWLPIPLAAAAKVGTP